MHVSSVASALPVDPNWNNWNWNNWNWNNWNWSGLFQFVVTAVIITLGFLHLLRSTTSKYFVIDTNFHSSTPTAASSSSSSSSLSSADNAISAAANAVSDTCAVCGKSASKHCAACKAIKYCSETCQSKHWRSNHRRNCTGVSGRANSLQRTGFGKRSWSVALVPSSGPDKTQKLVDKVLFPYDEFVKLFNRDTPIFPPCGLLNCGNSCFANVVLQCLVHTRPLLAYVLGKGHRQDCKRNEWCFLCELQTHMERASKCQQPFSPINILSRLPSIGGNLGYGKQEDAHEFMRFAIDTMQSVCLDEHGGEQVIHPKSQETTLIQHIFGGQLQSQVICTQCNQVSNQYENMMDLTVEIQGDATSLEDCLDLFTSKEWLHGENMYKCDGCNDYVRAWKRLTIHQAPNILTIALKRFQSGRFGKLNKKIAFPESLDLSPYVSEGKDGSDKYKLYAVVVHVDMLNASYFGHYICYTKGFQGNWYRIDDCKVMRVELDEVLSQGAYMLLYSRVSARPTCLKTVESALKQQQEEDKVAAHNEVKYNNIVLANSSTPADPDCSSAHIRHSSDNVEQLDHMHMQKNHLPSIDCASADGCLEDSRTVNPVSSLPVSVQILENGDDTSTAFSEGTHHAAYNSASAAAPASLYEANGTTFNPVGKLVEQRSETEPFVGGMKRDRELVSLTDKIADCGTSCSSNGSVGVSHERSDNMNNSEFCHLSINKMEYEAYPDYTEFDHVDLSESDHCSSGKTGDMITNGSAIETCQNTLSENFYSVQGMNSCVTNGKSELSSE